MSKSSGFGQSSSTEQTGRIRTGSPVRPTSGSQISNYQDITRLPKINFVDDLGDLEFDTKSALKSLKSDFSWDNLDDSEVASMFGALNKSKVGIRRDDPFEEDGEVYKYSVFIMNDYLNEPQERRIIKYSDGRVVINNDAFYLKQKFDINTGKAEVDPAYKDKGIGTKSLARQVYFSVKNGVSYLKTYAFRDDADNSFGHIVWPKLGFDRLLSPSEAAYARKVFKDPMIRTVLDVLEKPGGDVHWFQYGSSANMVFNLTPGSRSMRRLARSAKNKLSGMYGRLW